MDIGTATAAAATAQLSQQLQVSLQAIANTQKEALAVESALITGGQAVSSSSSLGQIVNLTA